MKKAIALFLALVMLLALTACGAKEESSAPANEGTAAPVEEAAAPAAEGERVLRVGCLESGGGFNPVGDQQSMIGNNIVYERIVQRQPDGSIAPKLCTSYEWADPLTLVFELRDDVYFSDGDKLHGEDVLYSFAMQATGIQASNYASVDFENSTISEDGLTVTFKFTQEYGPFTSLLDTPQIVNKSAVEGLASDEPSWWDQPIGSGPYMVTENISGSHAVYEPREDYWDKDYVHEWDRIIVNYFSDSTAMFIAFESGDLDLVCSVSANDAARLADSATALGEKAAYEFIGSNNVYCLTMNQNRPEFQDPKVREAVAHCVDVEGLGVVAFGELYKDADSVLSPGCSFYKSIGKYEYNVEYAQQCMAESGYPDGFTVDVIGISSPEVTAMWEVIQAGLSQIGITMNFQSLDLGTCLSYWLKPTGNDMMLMSVNGGNPMRDPYMCLSMTMESGPFAAARIPDAEYLEHINAATYTSSDEKREEEYAWIQQWCHDNFQAIPMVEDLSCYAYNTDVVANCEFYTGGTPNLLCAYAVK